MDDPFIFVLLITSLVFFNVLNSAFNSINQLKLELDTNKETQSLRALKFIGNNIQEFELSIKIYSILNLIVLTIFTYQILLEQILAKKIPECIYIIIVGLIILPAIIFTTRIFGEYFPNRIINFFSKFICALFILITPITYLLIWVSSAPIKFIFKDTFNSDQKIDFDKNDLSDLVSESQKFNTNDEGLISEIKFFQNALDFSEIKTRDCIIPRTEVEAVEINDMNENLEKLFIETGFSKIIIYKDSIDNIIGYVKNNSLLTSKTEPNFQIRNISFFPETMQVNNLLKKFIKTGQNIAVIVDEFGGTSGIITIEDILEEIFGEIQDEHDTDDFYEKQLSETDFVFSGRLEVDYLNDKYHLNIPVNEEYETIAGFIIYNTGNIPQISDRITIENFLISILKVSNTRVELVKFEVLNT